MFSSELAGSAILPAGLLIEFRLWQRPWPRSSRFPDWTAGLLADLLGDPEQLVSAAMRALERFPANFVRIDGVQTILD